MTKITYASPNKSDFIKELRTEVNHYFESRNKSKFGNLNLALKTIFMFALYLTPYFLMLSGVLQSWIAVYICWILMGLGKAGIGMGVMHDANHRTYSKHKTLNKLMGNSIYLLGGFPATWKLQHNNHHHGYTNIDGKDEDINPASILRFSPHKPLKKIHRYQHLYAWFLYGLMTILWSTSKDFKQLMQYKREGLPVSKQSYTQLMATLIVSKVLYHIIFLAIPIIVLPFAWYWVLFFFFTMHFVSGLILGTVFQTAHVVTTSEFPLPDQNGNMENTFAVHQLHNTADFAQKNKVLSWLIGGLNYQIEHHLFPGVSHVHYAKIAGLVKATAKKHNLPYYVNPGFFRAIREHARMLKQLGRA